MRREKERRIRTECERLKVQYDMAIEFCVGFCEWLENSIHSKSLELKIGTRFWPIIFLHLSQTVNGMDLGSRMSGYALSSAGYRASKIKLS